MTKEDIDNLFELLAIYRPKDRHLSDKTLKSAWLLVLEPFKPADVKQAVAAYFRGNKYWPDVSDISTRCPKAVEEAPPVRERNTGFSAQQVANINAQMDELLELGELMSLDYAAAGLPHPAEARKMGWSVADWNRCVREALK